MGFLQIQFLSKSPTGKSTMGISLVVLLVLGNLMAMLYCISLEQTSLIHSGKYLGIVHDGLGIDPPVDMFPSDIFRFFDP